MLALELRAVDMSQNHPHVPVEAQCFGLSLCLPYGVDLGDDDLLYGLSGRVYNSQSIIFLLLGLSDCI